jgi:ArsR family transcriptional regulator
MAGQNLLLEQPSAPAPVCCAPGTVMDRRAAEESAALLKAVADPVRLQLLSLIAGSPEQEACVCDMTGVVGVSQPTVSHHLKLLVEAGVLTRQRRGSWAWYALVPGRLEAIAGILTPAG